VTSDEAILRDRHPVLVLFGPTAVGKTAVALEVARRLDGEIISADSRAFFRELDIVTDKPTPAQRAEVPHHLVDCVPLDGAYDAMTFREDVARLVPDIVERGRIPLVVGGGTLYLGALLRGLFEGPGSDPRMRETLAPRSVESLHAELERIDPPAAAAIHPNDRLRLERAIEVHRLSGRPISAWQAEAAPLPFRFVVIGLQRERSEHRRAIAERVDRMLDEGLVNETERLKAAGLRPNAQAYRTIGIPESAALLAGEISIDEAATRIVSRTWQLARRQSAWFRREEAVRWIDVTGRYVDDVAGEVIEHWIRMQEER